MSIKHFIRNILITLFRFSGVTSLYRARIRREGPLVRIVVFHDVADEAWFDSLIGALMREYNVLTPQEFKEKKYREDTINVLVTFDDGYASWEYHVAPILEKHDVKGLFFVNSGLLDVAENTEQSDTFMREQLMISPRTPLTWGGAAALFHAGHTIGSHAQHHVNLAQLSLDEIRRELRADKERIESVLGTTVTDCAYPFGTKYHVSGEVEAVAQKVGFERGYTAISRFVGDSEPFRVPRMCIESNATPVSLRSWVEGGYDLFDMLKTICAR